MHHLKISDLINNYELPILIGFIFFGWLIVFAIAVLYVLLVM